MSSSPATSIAFDRPVVDPLPHQLPFDASNDELTEAVSCERDMSLKTAGTELHGFIDDANYQTT